MPEWHEVMRFRDILKDGTVIEAYTEDCDGDVCHWGVKENGVIVAEGSCRHYDDAREAAERIICCGAVPAIKDVTAACPAPTTV